MTAPTTTFNVADVILKLATEEDLNVSITGITDICYGLVITADKSFSDFCRQHSGPFNFQVIDGDPIRIQRRAIGDSLTIDYNISEGDCISRQGSPAIQFNRVDPETLPGQIEIQYIDPNREFAVTTQYSKHRHKKQAATKAGTTLSALSTSVATNTRVISSVSIDFIISADQARAMSFDYLYRIWSQQLSVTFEHKDLSIEAGDTIQLTADQGLFTLLVQESTITKARTNMIKTTALLTSSVIGAGWTADSTPIISGGSSNSSTTDELAALLVIG
jgi:hypothetical protein